MQSTSECLVPNCGRKVLTRGLCQAHYTRLVRHGEVRAHIPLQAKRPRGSSPRCSLSGCERPSKAKGLCDPHYSRLRRNGDASTNEPIRDTYRRYKDDYGQSDGLMRCNRCGEQQSKDEFNLKSVNSDVRARICRGCKSAYNAARRIANESVFRERERTSYQRDPELSKERARVRKIKRRMSIQTTEYDAEVTKAALRIIDGGSCSYCGQEMVFNHTGQYSWRPDYVNLDHVVPVAAGGSHTWENCVLACASCNLRKSDRVSGWSVRPGHRLYKTS